MRFSKLLIFLGLLHCSLLVHAHEHYTLRGYVHDASTGEPIGFANVFLDKVLLGATTDADGFFEIEDIHPDYYHISVSHIGCESQRVYLEISQDTLVHFILDHNSHLLNEVAVTTGKHEAAIEAVQSISEQQILLKGNTNLSAALEGITGVSSLKNGSNIAKPVVHGLYGNRLTILNHGVAMAGQQWGNDHAPEIDPLSANRISVVKGAGVVEYQGAGLGSVILMESKPISDDPHLHGQVAYFFNSNDRGHGTHLQLRQAFDRHAIRFRASAQKSGDQRAPKYWLNNMGQQALHATLDGRITWSPSWSSTYYLSSYNSQIGILRGAHIGNLTDFEDALTREVPFFTEDHFNYQIEAPKQGINHHIFNWASQWTIHDKAAMHFRYAYQFNDRREYDQRRSGRTDIPTMSMEQFAHFFEAKYEARNDKQYEWDFGSQLSIKDNTNQAETGILPLIPDFRQYVGGAFAKLKKDYDKWQWEIGGRYDFTYQDVLTITRTAPRQILRYQDMLHKGSVVLGAKYDFSQQVFARMHLGWVQRNPAINERYSFGLHQGVSSIEEGDPNISSETSFKWSAAINARLAKRWSIEALGYVQWIQDYIYLQVQEEVRLTIRGAFPVYLYEQDDARFVGLDLASTVDITKRLNWVSKLSILHAQNTEQNLAIVNVPSHNWDNELLYSWDKLAPFDEFYIGLKHRFVSRQSRLQETQVLAPAPDAYQLCGMQVGMQLPIKKMRLHLQLSGDNLLNARYREYLNRLHFFADEAGRNVRLSSYLKF